MSSKARPSVPDMLQGLAALFEERSRLYGDNYKRFGTIMRVLFPEGLLVTTDEDWNRVGVLIQVVGKLTRYANQWSVGHRDSLDDMAVYAMMLRELDEEMVVKLDARVGEMLYGFEDAKGSGEQL